MKRHSFTGIILACLFWMASFPAVAQRMVRAGGGDIMIRELSPQRGFEVVNTSARGPRLLARVPHGNMEKALQNPTFRWIMDCYGRAQGQPDRHLVLKSPTDAERVDPLLTDLWHQFAPYNSLTPLVDGQHCATGCVAHAMAQVIRYHRYARGQGSFTYTDSLGCGQTLTAEFPAAGYDFEQMLDRYDDGRYTAAQLDALAALLRDCGILVQMKYGVESSGAYSVRQPIALAHFFGYDKGMQMVFRDFYTYSEWEQLLRRELSAGRPVLMSASSPSLSHAFCCDGYDQQGLFHLNLGMAGDADGYYYLPYLTPKQPEWYDEDNPEGGMNLLQYMTIGIRPPGPADEPSRASHSFGFSHIKALNAGGLRHDTLSVATYDLSNLGWNYHGGKVSLLLKQDGRKVAELAPYAHEFLLEEVDDTTYTDTLSFLLPRDIAQGVYRIVPAFQEEDGTWEEARTSVGTPNYLLLKAVGDSVHVCADAGNTASLTLENFSFPDTIFRNSNPPFSFTLRCSDAEYCGRFYVILSPQDNPDDFRLIQYQGLTLLDGQQTVRSFNRTKVGIAPGTYHLRLAHDRDLFTDSLVWFSQTPLQTVQVVEPETGITAVDGAGARERLFNAAGVPVPAGRKPRGLVIQQTAGGGRKTIINR